MTGKNGSAAAPRARRACLVLLPATALAFSTLTAPAQATTTLDVSAVCENLGGGHFSCHAEVSDGVAPYTFAWTAISNVTITGSSTLGLLMGTCAKNTVAQVGVAVTDSDGDSGSATTMFVCSATGP
jgi:hypothetical protein